MIFSCIRDISVRIYSRQSSKSSSVRWKVHAPESKYQLNLTYSISRVQLIMDWNSGMALLLPSRPLTTLASDWYNLAAATSSIQLNTRLLYSDHSRVRFWTLSFHRSTRSGYDVKSDHWNVSCQDIVFQLKWTLILIQARLVTNLKTK